MNNVSTTSRQTVLQEECILYLYVERKSVFLEGVEVKNQLLPAFGKRRQVSIAIHIDRLALENLQEFMDQKKLNKVEVSLMKLTLYWIHIGTLELFK